MILVCIFTDDTGFTYLLVVCVRSSGWCYNCGPCGRESMFFSGNLHAQHSIHGLLLVNAYREVCRLWSCWIAHLGKCIVCRYVESAGFFVINSLYQVCLSSVTYFSVACIMLMYVALWSTCPCIMKPFLCRGCVSCVVFSICLMSAVSIDHRCSM